MRFECGPCTTHMHEKKKLARIGKFVFTRWINLNYVNITKLSLDTSWACSWERSGYVLPGLVLRCKGMQFDGYRGRDSDVHCKMLLDIEYGDLITSSGMRFGMMILSKYCDHEPDNSWFQAMTFLCDSGKSLIFESDEVHFFVRPGKDILLFRC